MLTARQRDALLFIDRFVHENGWSPSLLEIAQSVGSRHRSSGHGLVEQLIARGYVRRPFRRARVLEVIRLPEPTAKPVIPWVEGPDTKRIVIKDGGFPGAGFQTGDVVIVRSGGGATKTVAMFRRY